MSASGACAPQRRGRDKIDISITFTEDSRATCGERNDQRHCEWR
jgi:hypothetical protein